MNSNKENISIIYPRDIEILVYIARKRKATADQIQHDILNEASLPRVHTILYTLITKGLIKKDTIRIKTRKYRKQGVVYFLSEKGYEFLRDLRERTRDLEKEGILLK